MIPGWVLLALTVVSMLAGFVTGAAAATTGQDSQLCVRRGAKAGVWAVLSGTVVYVLLMATVPYFGRTFWPQAISGASLMPAMLGGTIAAALGMMAFRRPPEVKEDTAFEGEGTAVKALPARKLPAAARWGIRILIFAGLLFSLVVPFLPERPVQLAQVAAPKVESAPLPSPSPPPKPAPPPPPPFHYEVPAALSTAPPVAWSIETTRRLGAVPLRYGIAFSPDGRFVAHGGDGQDIVVRDLHSENVRRITGLPFPMRRLTFSPDGQRLFVVMESDPLRVGVAILQTGDFIPLPQPKKHAVPADAVVWWTPTTVLFDQGKEPPLSLNLEILEFDPVRLSDADAERFARLASPGFPETDRWRFGGMDIPLFAELPEVEGTIGWRWQGSTKLMLADLKHISRRIFAEIDLQPDDRVFGSPDGSKLLLCRSGSATALYFTTGPVPPLLWKMTFPHGPDRLKPAEATRKALETGQLSMLLYPPLVNPLNNRVIGPDREHPKAILRIRKWEGTTAEVWIEGGTFPWSAGDVFADVYLPGDPPVLLSFDQPHRWWATTPEAGAGADDPSKLPLWADLPKPRPKAETAEDGEVGSLSPAPANPGVPPERLAQIRQEVAAFITAHHQAALEGRLNEVVRDYAEKVDYLTKGTVNPAFILKDETEYRQNYRVMAEAVRGKFGIAALNPKRVRATYEFITQWQKYADNKTGGGRFEMVMELEAQPGGWKIVSQRTRKLN